ncbi:MAG: winged helix-turn-helix transcriptional regulator [Christensenellaceae bacterium]|nr:winged helix-turn-helix transcriptional regulator [Christensenellaceae bacterium]
MNQYIESETVELKAKYTDTFVRELVSFLNAEGGIIYIGIQNDGTVIGVDNIDNTLKNISDCITDQIEPSPRGEVISEIIHEENRSIIAVNVKKGIKPLYCIKKYGFSSKGCLVRIGTTCKEMSPEEIQFRYKSQFINEDYMLLAPSKYVPLSFNMMKILLTSRGFHINENSFEASFNLRRNDGTYNLLAEILADQNMVPLIFVKFAGINKASISHRSDYGGQSLLLGYQKMKDRLIAENICKTDTTVRPRIDEYLYDIDCANEALVNMFVHNDWTITEPQVSFYSDRVVFTSHGGIPHGMTEEEFYNGVSRPRNAVLMRVFLNLGIVEHTGHGIPMIVEKYGREAFDIHQNYINVTLPFNQAVLASVPQIGTDHGTDDKGIRLNEDLSDTEKKLILELIKNPKYTYNQLASEIGISRRTVSRTVASLVEKKYIERIGNNKSGFWKIIR